MLTAKISTRGRLVLPERVRERSRARPGDTFELIECDEPNVIILRKLTTHANDGMVDALLARPHKLELPPRRRDYPKLKR